MASSEDSENKMDGSLAAVANGSFSFATNDRRVLKKIVVAKRPVSSPPINMKSAPIKKENLEDSVDEEEKNPIIWSPSKQPPNLDAAATRIVDEHLSNQRAAANHRREEHRHSKYKEKRSADTTTKSTSINGSKPNPTGTIHPMSKSLFHVRTSQPNHKRPATATTDDDIKPEEKIMRVDDDDDDTKAKGSFHRGGKLMVVATVVVAIAAIVLMAVRRRRA